MAQDQPKPIEGNDVTFVLTIAAVIATLTLLGSASRTGASATPSDPYRRGPWGILERDRSHSRRLGPHERRWQTAITAGRDNEGRWRDLVNDIDLLGRFAEGQPTSAPPDEFDAGWIDRRIEALEADLHLHTTPEETP